MESFKFVFGYHGVKYEENQENGPRKDFASNILL